MPLSNLLSIIALAGAPHYKEHNTSRYDNTSRMPPTNQKSYHYVIIVKIEDSDLTYQGRSLSTWYEQSRQEAVRQSSSTHQFHNRHSSRSAHQISYERAVHASYSTPNIIPASVVGEKKQT